MIYYHNVVDCDEMKQERHGYTKVINADETTLYLFWFLVLSDYPGLKITNMPN